MNIIIIGPQGSGKSTQAQLLAERLGLPHLQTGQIYRNLALQDTPLGRQINNHLVQGLLVPDDVHQQILTLELQKPLYRSGFVLDGSPRNLFQAQQFPVSIDRVYYLRVSDKENLQRLLLRQRHDDTPPLITKRLAIYHQQTEPVLDFFRQQGVLEEIDGERSIDEIAQDLYSRIRKLS